MTRTDQLPEHHPDHLVPKDHAEGPEDARRLARMEPNWWHPAVQLPGLLLWGLGMVLGHFVQRPHATPAFDLAILRGLEPDRSHLLVAIAKGIEFWDGPKATPYLMLAALVLIFLRGHRLLAVLAVFMTALSWLPGHIAKTLFPRVRPPASVDPVLHVTGPNSYPSGHTGFITATTIAGIFVLTALGHTRARRIWAVVGSILVVVVGLSRMLLAVHYPTDVLGGALLAGGMSLVLWPLLSGVFAVVGHRWPSWTR